MSIWGRHTYARDIYTSTVHVRNNETSVIRKGAAWNFFSLIPYIIYSRRRIFYRSATSSVYGASGARMRRQRGARLLTREHKSSRTP